MGMVRTIASVSATAGTPTPVLTGTVNAAASFSITGNIATIVLTPALPANGYNGPRYDLSGTPGIPAGGQQVTLWGFTTATYFNGKTITVLDNDGSHTFRFAFTHANVNSTNDAGKTAAVPTSHYRAVRLEIDEDASTHIIYVGDMNVSTEQYMAKLTLAGQLSVEIASENIPADRVMIDTDNTGTRVQVSLIY